MFFAKNNIQGKRLIFLWFFYLCRCLTLEFSSAYSDQTFYAKISLHGSVFTTDQCLVKYRRRRSDSAVAIVNRAGRFDAGRLFYLNWLEEYMSVEGFRGTQIWNELQKQKNKNLFGDIDVPNFIACQ